MEKLMREIRGGLKPRSRAAHKGDFGRVFILAGSVGYTGAAHLAGLGALRSGAGLVTLGVPSKVYPVIARREMEIMTRPFPSASEGCFALSGLSRILKFAASQDVLAAGPGLSTHPSVRKLVLALIKKWPKPLVLDADALNALRGNPELLRKRRIPAVLTPHTGEFVRLFGGGKPVTKEQRIQSCVRAAALSRAVVVLKGQGTVTASPEGLYTVNPTGNPGMASGGTGDVLTGMIAALLGQGLEPFDAARFAVYVHGLAGDLAAVESGEISLTAGDLAEQLANAFKKILGVRKR